MTVSFEEFPHHIFYEKAQEFRGSHLLLTKEELNLLVTLAHNSGNSQVKKILELGSFIGRTSCFLSYLGFTVWSIERDQRYYQTCINFQTRLHLTDMTFLNMDALSFLERHNFDWLPFDLVFVDADKSRYLTYFRLLSAQLKLSKLKTLVFDNVFLNGQMRDRVIKYVANQGGAIVFWGSQVRSSSYSGVLNQKTGRVWSRQVEEGILQLLAEAYKQFSVTLYDTCDGFLVITVPEDGT
ncbi:MAG: hypothetical protein NZ480_03925 [Bdellovibrionaceae bacterium]|nr:hypothetical protein [Pseudobdellovibrionaceae bacterium]